MPATSYKTAPARAQLRVFGFCAEFIFPRIDEALRTLLRLNYDHRSYIFANLPDHAFAFFGEFFGREKAVELVGYVVHEYDRLAIFG